MTAPAGPRVIVAWAAAAAVLVVVAIGLFVVVRPDSAQQAVTPADTVETGAPSGETAAAYDEHAPSLGQQVRDGDFAFVVTGVDRVEAISDPEIPELQKTAVGEYLIVRMTVTNVGAEPQTLFASFHTLSDGARTYESDDEAWIYLGNTLADLHPGDTINTEVVFDVPDGTEPESIELHDGPYSDGVTVELE